MRQHSAKHVSRLVVRQVEARRSSHGGSRRLARLVAIDGVNRRVGAMSGRERVPAALFEALPEAVMATGA